MISKLIVELLVITPYATQSEDMVPGVGLLL